MDDASAPRGRGVCSLPADALRDRIAHIRREVAPHVRRSDEIEGGVAWEFDAGMRETLERLVALERECCSGLEWTLAAAHAGVRLEVRGAGAAGLAAILDPSTEPA